MTPLYMYDDPPGWWRCLTALDEALAAGAADAANRAYAGLLRDLAAGGHDGVASATADLLLFHRTPFSRAAMAGTVPEGLARAVRADLDTLLAMVRRDWAAEVQAASGALVPPLAALAEAPEGAGAAIAEAVASAGADEVASILERRYRAHGDGPLARHLAFRWHGGALQGIPHPAMPPVERLVGLDTQLERLGANTRAFLARSPAHHALLYGPRGSGKSTAIRGLLTQHHVTGLRLVEVPAEDLADLPEVLEALRGRPHRYVLFVDDLSFEAGDTTYHPLKTLLEGSLTEPPSNALLYATSNRRHLVRESFGDRPDPLDDDVHAWDTHHERLALADRFGLAITFPDATQRRYLEIVRGLLGGDGGDAADLESRAIRFAEWGNGYSGRTAEQFVRSLQGGAGS